jgi:hypothetical protein
VRLLGELLETLRVLTKAVRMRRLALCGPCMDRVVCALNRQQKQLGAHHPQLLQQQAERLCLGYLKVGSVAVGVGLAVGVGRSNLLLYMQLSDSSTDVSP